MTNRQLFFNRLAQTSPAPPALEIKSAKGIYLRSANGKKYMDLISGISVSNVGHANPKVTAAIKKQLDKHSYLMVYGEYVVAPQVEYANLLVKYLPKKLNNVYFVNTGSEAVEGALKLAKRYTGRTEIIFFKNAYHGSTHGALSVMGNEAMKQVFRPLLPDVRQIEFNNEKQLEQITKRTACVIIEPIQGEAGVILPTEDVKWPRADGKGNYLQRLRKRCDETGALLIFDEVQTGMGRTGEMFAFEKYKVVPDILCLAKAFGGGMPLGAFIASKEVMSTLSHNPVLGHITTFGGHPLSCVAGIEAFKEVKRRQAAGSRQKGELFKKLLVHPRIKEVRGEGLLIAVQFASEEENKRIISRCVEKGIITDWFLFNASAMRIAPPLIITEKEIKKACEVILRCIDQ
ncbi:MAG: aspartate aminotransferase family protein [Bacteroidetes bacterium]|nr:MAG: aspartate aminotransferase family protein [Bacteroidota bacterium]